MKRPKNSTVIACAIFSLVSAGASIAQVPDNQPPRPDDRPGQRGSGPVGPMGGGERKIVTQFDKDGDKRLNKDERAEAREFLKKNPAPQGRRGGPPGAGGGPPDGFRPPGGGGGFGPPPGMGGEDEPVKEGRHITPAEVKTPDIKSVYAPNVLRTLFLDSENADWEAEMTEFHGTDVEVPATLTVDGVKYPGVGIHFRGMSSYMMVKAGHKRSMNVSIDFTEKKQRLDGYKTLNLLNAHEDASFLSNALYSQIARQYIPTPKVNLVRVVINGENWGVYANQQQFDKDFVQENFKTDKGARWKVRGSPMGGGGLEYLGDDVAEYKRHYEMKSGKDEDWTAFVALCRALNTTPVAQLESALAPMLDTDGLLWFLALDCGLINCDGYWIRASDYSIYRDAGGKFHIVPADMNEAFRQPQGPGMGGGPGGGRPSPTGVGGERRSNPPGMNAGGIKAVNGVELDPLVGLDDTTKPLRSKVLAVSSLRTRYLQHVRTIAQDSLDWKKLGPVVAQYRALIEKDIEADTRKLTSFADFQKITADVPVAGAVENGRRGPGSMPLRTFADQRRAYLLAYPEIAKLPR